MSLRPTSRPLVGALALLLGVATGAQALTIAPARLELTGDPGATISGEFVVTNEEPSAFTFYTSAQNFEARGESGTPNFVTSDTGLASWIDAPSEITLAQGERRVVPFTVTIPADADAGGHFAAIFLSTAPPTDAQVTIGAKIGVLVLLRVAGDVVEAGGVSDFTVQQRFVSSLPVNYTYRFTNDGGDRVNPRGDIVIRNIIGLKKEVVRANPTEGNVLPGSTRKFETTWGDTTIAKPTSFFGMVGYQLEHFAVGPYRSKLVLDYGVSGHAEATAWVFVIPWQLILVVAVVLLALFPLVRVAIRRYNQWIIGKAQAQ